MMAEYGGWRERSRERRLSGQTTWDIPDGAFAREWYWRARRGDAIKMNGEDVCLCGRALTKHSDARIWVFTRNRDNTSAVRVMCIECDILMVADLEEVR